MILLSCFLMLVKLLKLQHLGFMSPNLKNPPFKLCTDFTFKQTKQNKTPKLMFKQYHTRGSAVVLNIVTGVMWL